MRILFLTGSPARYMAPPQLGDEQINAGPDWPDVRDSHGRWVSLQTPVGEYPVAAVLAKLPMEQWPDVLVCLVDSSRRNLPRQTAAFKGPRVLLIADTHHLEAPLVNLVRYAVTERFDRSVLLYDRHHAVFFRTAGIKNLFWFPGLTFPHADAAWCGSARKSSRRAQVAFAGQNGRHHPRRARLLQALEKAGVPLEARLVPQESVLPFYAGNTLGFNASLNGDLNLRVFEVLASGAMLLTDELVPEAGLAHLATHGCAVETYADERELVDRAQHWLARTDEARTRTEPGLAWLKRHFCAAARRAMFQALVMDGRAPEIFPMPSEPATRVAFRSGQEWLTSTGVFEGVQELHRTQEQVRMTFVGAVPAGFVEFCRTLPRLRDAAPGDVCDLWVGSSAEPPPPSQLVRRAWCFDAVPAERMDVIARWAEAGFAFPGSNLAFFNSADGEALREAADSHLRHGRNEFAAATMQGLIAREPDSVPVLELAGRLALATRDADLARQLRDVLQPLAPESPHAKRMLQALRPLTGEVAAATEAELAMARAAAAGRRWADVTKHALAAANADPVLGEPYALVAEALLAAERFADAVKPTALARMAAPWEAESWRRNARVLRGLRRPTEALNDLMHAAYLAPECANCQVELAEVALELEMPGLARVALAAARRLDPQRAGLATLAAKIPDETDSPETDLLLLHAEPSRLHGTGVLLQRFFAGGPALLTLRSHSLYQGQCDLPGTHLVLEVPGLSLAEEARRLRLLLSGRRIGRILCVPFYAADFRRAVLAKEMTGAKLAVYVMDDQTLHQGNVPPGLAQRCFAAADLRLVISQEMQSAYRERFRSGFDVLPPIVTSTAERVPNHWSGAGEAENGRVRAALVGNIWSADQFARLRAITRRLEMDVDWFGNAAVAWLPRDPASYAADGIHARGFVPEAELARRLATYPFVIVPSGTLDGTEDNEWLTRLSLPSRMVFIVAQTLTPMLVLGHPSTAAAGWVDRHGLGAVAPYEVSAVRAALTRLLDPVARAAMTVRAQRVAEAHTMPRAGEWIWQSLAAGAALPSALDALDGSLSPDRSSLAQSLVA